MQDKTESGIIWEWSIRVFHSLFAASISVALGIALLGDDDAAYFEWHMLAGLIAGFLLLVRLVLFVVGSRPVNLQGLLVALKGVPAYLRGFFGRKTEAGAGHNPMAWAVYLLMFGLLVGSVLTGVNMRDGWIEDIHGFFAWSLLAMIVAHLLGLALHTFRYRENIALSMVTGRKKVPEGAGLKSQRPLLGLAVLAVCAVFIVQLLANYQMGTGQVEIPWIQKTVLLGEQHEGGNKSEDDDHGKQESGEEHESHDHDD